ncbi:MAG: hypothetical protein EOO92_12640, partial [Pedobacter sp.]
NKPVKKVDIVSYAGKWYSLYSIPTIADNHFQQTTQTYVIHPDGYYAVFTTYKVHGEDGQKYVRSKLFVVRGTGNARLKLQLIWPFKTDYWIIELAEDYSYVVIGHPKHKHLAIMARKSSLPEELVLEIINRCEARGYDTSRLVSQGHNLSSSAETLIANA